MITPLLILKLTLVLVTAMLSLVLCRALDAGLRNRFCTAAIALALLLPIFGLLGAAVSLPLPASFTFVVSSAALPARAFHIPWQGLWLAGVVLVAARSVAGLFYLARRSRAATPHCVADPLIRIELNAAAASVGLAPVQAPLVWGWLNPIVLLPESAESWPTEKVRLALLHELAHMHRLDLWSSLLWMSAKAIYWFHPLVWWLSARAQEDQELACDARVLASGAAPAEYAGFLVDIARHVHSPAVFGCAMVSHPNLLRGRVMHILQSQRRSPSAKALAGLCVSLGLMAAAGFIALAAPDHPDPASDEHVYKIAGDVSAPRVISKVEPQYSQNGIDKKIEGSVLLHVVIDQSGHPEDIQIKRSLDPDLDANAVAAVTQWRFVPAMKAGKPVAVEANIEVNFRIVKDRKKESR